MNFEVYRAMFLTLFWISADINLSNEKDLRVYIVDYTTQLLCGDYRKP